MEQDVFNSEPIEDIVSENEADNAHTDKYLLFQSGELLFGVTADYVVEIITNHVITPLPLVPAYVRGIINLRGQIIPIVDIRLFLGQPDQKDNCIMILNINETLVGILVDTVQRMIDVNKSSLLPAPKQGGQRLVSGMCSLPDGSGTMLVLEGAQVIHE